ncbi:MAG: hypothetical protein IH944_00810 [Armatimonadetes bacterium]|nr:hypothetical protein [Armatimonadota bacterium]
MGRNIGGGCVGCLAYFLISSIIVLAIAFILSAEGVIDTETKAPTSAFLAVLAVVTALAAYLAGAITRAISKSPIAVYVVAGLLTIVALYQVFNEPNPAQLEQLETLGDSWFAAVQYASLNSPTWFGIVTLLLMLAGFAIGGLNSGDFKKQDEPQPVE